MVCPALNPSFTPRLNPETLESSFLIAFFPFNMSSWQDSRSSDLSSNQDPKFLVSILLIIYPYYSDASQIHSLK